MSTRVVTVGLISLLSIALWAPDVPRIFGHGLGKTGFTVGQGNMVVAVDRGSPAERAGIRPGQRIDFNGTPVHSRLLIINANFQNLHPIQRFPVRVVSGARAFTAIVSSEPETQADTATVLPRIIFEMVLLVAGIALLLLRPSKATWGFFIFSAIGANSPINAVIWIGPQAYQVLMTILISPWLPFVSQLGAIIFALYVLIKPPVANWRRLAEGVVYAVGVATTILVAWPILSSVYYARPISASSDFAFVIEIAAAFAPPLILAATYLSSHAATRERLRWVIFAFVVHAFVISVITATGQSVIPWSMPYWLWATLSGIDTLIVAFAVLYAVLKHHIIDINVAISRAVVYTILSAIAVGAFALVDLFFTRAVSSKNAGLMADIGLALILGFFFNSMHARIDRFVDWVLFRNRHKAEEHLRTVIRAMPFTVSEQQVDLLVVEEPVRSFALVGAILFACDDNGAFALRHYFGVSPPRFTLASREETLPVYLQGEHCALRLNSHGWELPAIAIPIFSHGDLTAICIYGLHENGTDLDGEEIAIFEELAGAAGNAYDRLEAKRLREEVRDLRLARI